MTLLQMKIDLFDNKFALFVLLVGFVSLLVSPANKGVATFAENVADCVQPSDQATLLRRSQGDIHTLIKQIGTTYYSAKDLTTWWQ